MTDTFPSYDPRSEDYDHQAAHDRAWPLEAAERQAREAAEAGEPEAPKAPAK
jgi:hypothetical protein